MANNVTNTLTANITSTEDVTSNVPINRGTGNPSFDSIFGEFTTYQALANGANVLTLPGAVVYQWYIRNNDPAGTIQVKITPNGIPLITTVTLYPGDVYICWQKPGNANAGVTSITLTTVAGGILVEYFLGG